MLEIRNLSHSFIDGEERRLILDDINYTFESGKLYSILGYSGSGKSTLISFLAGLDVAEKGEILYNGSILTNKYLSKYRRNDCSVIFQNYNLINYLSATDNLITAMDITENNIPGDKKDVATNLLDFVGIVNTKSKRVAKKLSGGERQRVAIARALSTNVELIFADEPTGNLDLETENEIVQLFKSLAHEHNKCIIIVTHSQEVAAQTDVILRLNKGSLYVE